MTWDENGDMECEGVKRKYRLAFISLRSVFSRRPPLFMNYPFINHFPLYSHKKTYNNRFGIRKRPRILPGVPSAFEPARRPSSTEQGIGPQKSSGKFLLELSSAQALVESTLESGC
mgnify:CR=1 FL=1